MHFLTICHFCYVAATMPCKDGKKRGPHPLAPPLLLLHLDRAHPVSPAGPTTSTAMGPTPSTPLAPSPPHRPPRHRRRATPPCVACQLATIHRRHAHCPCGPILLPLKLGRRSTPVDLWLTATPLGRPPVSRPAGSGGDGGEGASQRWRRRSSDRPQDGDELRSPLTLDWREG